MLLFTGQEFEELGYGVQQYLRIAVVQVCARQEIRTDHLQTVAAGFVSSQHQGRRVDRLLDHRNLALVDLEIDNGIITLTQCRGIISTYAESL